MPKVNTIPKDVFDKLIHEQIDFARYGNSVVRDILKVLNDADKEIVAKLTARGIDGTLTTARLNALLIEIRATVKEAYATMGKNLQGELEDFAQHAGESSFNLLDGQLPVAMSPVAMTAEQLAALVTTTPISLGKDKKLLFAEIFQKLTEGKIENVKGAIRLGIVQGESISEIVRRLVGTRANRYQDGILELDRRNVSNMVRSAVLHTSNQAAQATYAANDDLIKGWVYVATLDSRTCPICFSVSGQSYELGKGPVPPQHVSCRCFSSPIVKTWRELGLDMDEFATGKRASKDGLVDANISFNDWLKTQDSDTQIKLLGKTRAGMFAEGKLTLDKFTDSSGELYTLEELRTRNK